MVEPLIKQAGLTLYHGDNREVLPAIADCSVDAVITDPPYGLSFMGRKWDYDVPTVEQFKHCLRVLKPGGHLLCFAGTRTYHRVTVNIEDAGFEIRDMLSWVYGNGYPKSKDMAKADESLAGWGTGLKPSVEPIAMARKPVVGLVAENMKAHGVGAINIEACRVPGVVTVLESIDSDSRNNPLFKTKSRTGGELSDRGRWPANLLHDGSEEVVACFPYTESGQQAKHGHQRNGDKARNVYAGFDGHHVEDALYGDCGSAARFFYCAKADKTERGSFNSHTTVKPIDLMRWMIRLVTPKGATVLDPWAGSGTTILAAQEEFVNVIAIERESSYCEIIRRRVGGVTPTLPGFF